MTVARRALRLSRPHASVLALAGLLASLGCASSGGTSRTYDLPNQRVAHPACERHWIEMPPDVEPGAPLSRPQPQAPRGGPPSGYACVAVTLTEEGRLVDPEILATDNEPYAAYFLEVLEDWRFEPATRNGEPVAVRTLMSVSYRRVN